MSGIPYLIRLAAILAAIVLIGWLLMDLVGADTGDPAVRFFRTAADWLATWSRGLFDGVANATGRAVLVYGVPAFTYLGLASVLRHATLGKER
ncbi:hypothetical protein [Streptacidiphilus fuscans]|uniref:Uncharacterized protein n=1 Tax=Streptacidiphilus fuscans TaxID=2789292 RepID=A0A931FEW4_9ACTN|nr:hypothetical protein [Streptacidiphilus fuscans]MBF9069126.1 hypothetical protein [Streptacidiphilus fuscans]